MSAAAEDSTDGKKYMPEEIIHSLVIAMLPHVAAAPVFTGMQNYRDIDPTAGFASAFNGVGLPHIATSISVFAVLPILAVMLTFLLGATHVWFSTSCYGLLPSWFAKTDRQGTPQRLTSIEGIAIVLLAALVWGLYVRDRLPLQEAGRPPHLPVPLYAGGPGVRRDGSKGS